MLDDVYPKPNMLRVDSWNLAPVTRCAFLVCKDHLTSNQDMQSVSNWKLNRPKLINDGLSSLSWLLPGLTNSEVRPQDFILCGNRRLPAKGQPIPVFITMFQKFVNGAPKTKPKQHLMSKCPSVGKEKEGKQTNKHPNKRDQNKNKEN